MSKKSAASVAKALDVIEVVRKPGCKSENTVVYEHKDTKPVKLRLPKDIIEVIETHSKTQGVSVDSTIATMLANVRMGDIPIIVKSLNPTK